MKPNTDELREQKPVDIKGISVRRKLVKQIYSRLPRCMFSYSPKVVGQKSCSLDTMCNLCQDSVAKFSARDQRIALEARIDEAATFKIEVKDPLSTRYNLQRLASVRLKELKSQLQELDSHFVRGHKMENKGIIYKNKEL